MPEASKDLLRAMADQMLWWQEQVNDGPDPSAHEGVTSETLLPHNVHQLPAPSWESHAADSEAGKTSGQDIDPDQLPDE